MQQKKIINLKFDDTISIGAEIIPIDQNYVNESNNLPFLHRADFFCIILKLVCKKENQLTL